MCWVNWNVENRNRTTSIACLWDELRNIHTCNMDAFLYKKSTHRPYENYLCFVHLDAFVWNCRNRIFTQSFQGPKGVWICFYFWCSTYLGVFGWCLLNEQHTNCIHIITTLNCISKKVQHVRLEKASRCLMSDKCNYVGLYTDSVFYQFLLRLDSNATRGS